MESRTLKIAGLHDVQHLQDICRSEGLKFNNCVAKELSASFKCGDYVWAKMKGFPPWPAKIIVAEITSKKFYVFFFGSKNYAWIPDKNIMRHNKSTLNIFSKMKSRSLKHAIDELKKEISLKPPVIIAKKKQIRKYKGKTNANSSSRSDTPSVIIAKKKHMHKHTQSSTNSSSRSDISGTPSIIAKKKHIRKHKGKSNENSSSRSDIAGTDNSADNRHSGSYQSEIPDNNNPAESNESTENLLAIPVKKKHTRKNNRVGNGNSSSQSEKIDMPKNSIGPSKRNQSKSSIRAIFSKYTENHSEQNHSLEDLSKPSSSSTKVTVINLRKESKVISGDDSSASTSLSQNNVPTSKNSSDKKSINIREVHPISFHIHRKNAVLFENRTIAMKTVSAFHAGYVFTERPIEINESILMTISAIPKVSDKELIFGITSCDPKTINPRDLPEDADDLLDWPHYWTVLHHSRQFIVGDQLTFKLDSEGEVQCAINGISSVEFYADHTQPLWIFIVIGNSITQLHMEGAIKMGGASKVPKNYNKKLGEPGPSGLSQSNCGNILNSCNCEICTDLEKDDEEDSKIGVPGPSGLQSRGDCVICYAEEINCALYKCGHMCTCYNCAFILFNSFPFASCPVCREVIQDVLKVYYK